MADAERYVSQAELEGELPFDARDFPVQSEGDFGMAVRRALDSASETAETWAETVFTPTQTEATLSRPIHAPEYELPLPERPIQSVASVDVEGDALTEGADYHVEETYLDLDPDALVDKWPTDRRSITVTWTYGFEAPPEPVREAIIRMARNALEQIETDGINTEGSWQYRPPAKIKQECAGTVNQHSAPSYHGGVSVI